MSELRERMRRLRESSPAARPPELAQALLREARKQDFLHLVEEEFWRLERDDTRRAEREALMGIVARGPRPVAISTTLHDLRPVLDRYVRWMSGEERLFRHMTREQHQARIDMLLTKRAGIDRSIELHRDAIGLLDKTGALCLSDVEEAEAA